jgi:hypothetical protein
MLCKACGGELILTRVVADGSIRECEHHTFICPACHVTEQRAVFVKNGREDASRPVPEGATPAVLPALSIRGERRTIPGLLARVAVKLRWHSTPGWGRGAGSEI